MFPKPMVPLSPVTVKDNAVVSADWFVVIVTMDIWELVMFPLIARSTVELLLVVAGKVVVIGVGVGIGVGIGVEIGVGVGVGIPVAGVVTFAGGDVIKGKPVLLVIITVIK
jgi:hypothetical protein